MTVKDNGNHLYEGTYPRFRHLIGKKVKFTCKGKVHVGILGFAGINEFLHGQFQVTASKTPYWPVDPNSIEEVTDTIIRITK